MRYDFIVLVSILYLWHTYCVSCRKTLEVEMLMSLPQINNIQTIAIQNNNSQEIPTAGASAKPNGFMSMLSLMMSKGNNQNAQIANGLKGQDTSINIIKDFLENNDINNSAGLLLITFLQSLMSDNQRFQEILQELNNTGNNIMSQLAQINYGHIKDGLTSYSKERLDELIQSLQTRLNNLANVNPDEVRRIINEEIRNLFSKRGLCEEVVCQRFDSKTENKSAINSIPEIQTTNMSESTDISKVVALNKGVINSQQDMSRLILDSNKPKSSFANPDGFNLKSIIEDDEGFLNKINLTPASDKNINSSVLLDDIIEELNLQDVEFTETNTQTINKNQQVGVNDGSRQQSTPVKNDAPVKETLYVSKIQDIDTKILKAIHGDSKTLTVRLEPPELGSVHIRLVLSEGGLRADLKVDNPAVKDMMNLALPQIRNTLENSGIKVSEFFVDIREEFYSDGKKQEHDKDNDQKSKGERQKDKDSKPFEYYI